MADKALIIKETQRYLAKGQIDKAIAEWENFLQSSPDANCFNALGDLYLKKNNQQAGIEKFHHAAEIFRKEGFSLKALALYKKILNIEPSDAKSLDALGELSEEKNIAADAVKYYHAAAGLYMKSGRKAAAVRTYSRMVRLSADNLPLRKQIADVYSKEGFVEEASCEYVEIARLLGEKGENQEAITYLERAVEIKPSNNEALAATASIYEKLGDTGKAIESLKAAISRAGRSDASLLRLAGLCLHAGKTAESRQYAGELLRMDPGNAAAKRLLADACFREGDMKEAWAQYAPVIDELVSRAGFDEARGIVELFMEPEPIQARRMLISLLKQENDSAGVLKELKELGKLLRASGDLRGAAECLNEALSVSPDDEQIAGMLRDLAQEGDGAAEEKAEETADNEEVTEEDKSVQEIIAQADRMLSDGLAGGARELLESFKLKAPGNVQLHRKLKSVYLAANDRQQAVTECIILAELYRRAGDETKRAEVIDEAFAIDPADERLPERFGRSEETNLRRPEAEKEKEIGKEKENTLSAAEGFLGPGSLSQGPDAPVQPAVRMELSEKLSEASFYLHQGLYEEAEKIYRELIVHFPDDEAIRDRLEEIEALKAQPDACPSVLPVKTGGQDPDAGDASENGMDDDVGRIFDEFKKGVEKQIDPGDAETRYNLGIAYKEMGLLDDAIREFQTILTAPAFGVKAASVLAVCHMEKGLYPQAVEVLKAAIEKVDPAHDAYWGLKYDLAQALEKNAKPKEALELYMEVCRRNSGFREVAARITALGGAVPGGNGGKAPSRKDRISYI